MKKREDSSQRHCFNLGIKSIEEMKKKKFLERLYFIYLLILHLFAKGH